MSEFENVAHKTVAELFDMLKAKVAAIQEMDEVIKLQDADLRKYEKQIEGLKAQLNNMETCYIEKKKQVEDQQKRIDAGLEKIRQFGKEGCLFPEWLTWAEKALRGES